METLKLGIVGAGRLGSFHADKAVKHKEITLVGVMDSSEQRRRDLAEKHGIADYSRVADLLPHVDAVVIAAPTHLHHALGIECLKAGIHVLMEKPLAVSEEEAKELVKCAEDKQLVLQVGHVEQYNPAWELAAPVLQVVKSGTPAIITAERTSGYTFRSTDVGVVHDLMIHDLDLILSIVPSAIRSMDASGFHVIGSTKQGGHEDIAHAWIRFENGTIAEIHVSRVDAEPRRKMRIQTQYISADIDFASRETKITQASEQIVSGRFSPAVFGNADPTELAKTFMYDQFSSTKTAREAVDALTLEIDDFVQAIRTGRKSQVPGSRALKAVAAADAISQMLR